jgi:hypothetical protein
MGLKGFVALFAVYENELGLEGGSRVNGVGVDAYPFTFAPTLGAG